MNNVEIERRWLCDPAWVWAVILEKGLTPALQRQGYLVADDTRTLRVRTELKSGEGKAYFTLKGKKDEHGSGVELEGEMNYLTALDMLTNGGPLLLGTVTKFRYNLGLGWSVDVFTGPNQGLVIAEYEGKSVEDVSQVAVPSWCMLDVTNNHAYSCSQLAQKPISITHTIEFVGGGK